MMGTEPLTLICLCVEWLILCSEVCTLMLDDVAVEELCHTFRKVCKFLNLWCELWNFLPENPSLQYLLY